MGSQNSGSVAIAVEFLNAHASVVPIETEAFRCNGQSGTFHYFVLKVVVSSHCSMFTQISWCRRRWLYSAVRCSCVRCGCANSTTHFGNLLDSELSFADKRTHSAELGFFVFSLRAGAKCQIRKLDVRVGGRAQLMHTAISRYLLLLNYPLRTKRQ